MLIEIWAIRFRQLNEQSLSECHWYAQERNSMEPTGTDEKNNHKRPGYWRTQD